MRISELEPNTKVINLVVTLESIDEPSKTPNGTAYQNGIVTDDTGQVKIVFWDDQVSKFRAGDKLLMSTGWAKTFMDEMQISSGKFGKITIVPKKVD